MVHKLNMLDGHSHLNGSLVGNVYLLTGSLTHVQHIGASRILGGAEITNVLHIREFKYNILFVSKLTRKLNCCALFYPDFCLFQELSSRKVRGIGRVENDLYVINAGYPLKSQVAQLNPKKNQVNVVSSTSSGPTINSSSLSLSL